MYCVDEKFVRSVTKVPGGRSTKKDSVLNRIKAIAKSAFANIKPPKEHMWNLVYIIMNEYEEKYSGFQD